MSDARTGDDAFLKQLLVLFHCYRIRQKNNHRSKAVLKGGRLFHYPKKENMSLYCVKASLKLRADAALTPIYASVKSALRDGTCIARELAKRFTCCSVSSFIF